ncbi:MAG: stress-induced protein, KGG, repeat-containing protein [Minisyncoccia bacterium]
MSGKNSQPENTPNVGDMSVRKAGQKGGNVVKDRYGPDFYKEIGRKGGLATRQRHGDEFYREIGVKGGQEAQRLIRKAAEANAQAEGAAKKPVSK